MNNNELQRLFEAASKPLYVKSLSFDSYSFEQFVLKALIVNVMTSVAEGRQK